MDSNSTVTPTTRLPHAVVAMLLVVGIVAPIGTRAAAAESVTETFTYEGTTRTFVVPDGVSTITVTMRGGQGGRGGGDSQGSPTPGGYRGLVSGTIDVTPGQEITVAVGGGGRNGVSSRGSAAGGAGGQNPLSGYDGAVGGQAGPQGSSGGGGGSGAATVIRIDGNDVVAAGAGGNGGNGQFLPIVGRRAEENHQPRPDATSTDGRRGMDTTEACSEGYRCDGGASGAGGAGAQGGERGDVQYGGASATEYFGFGGYPGSNDTAGIAGLAALYEYYEGNGANGSVTISYDSGSPGAPRSVTGTPAPGSVQLAWSPPGESGAAEITDYRVEYATSPAGPYVDFEDGVTAATGAEVTGLDNGTAYWFRVTAVNSYGEGPPSAAMAEGVVPSDVPDAPSVDTVGPIDSGLRLEVTPGHSDSPIVSWEYRLGDGSWSPANEADGTVTIGGLTNGTTYQVRIRALNAVGASGASAPVVGTPRSVPGAPSALLAQPSDSVVSLQWDAPGSDNGAAVSDYVVQYATNSSGPFVTHPDGLGTARSAVVGGLTNGTTYHFRVAAVNAAGTGPSSALAAATPFTLPGSPVIASLEGADGSLVVDLAASDDGGAAIIRHEYRLDGGAWESTGSAVEPFTISGLANGTTRQVEVRSVNAAGAGPASEPASGTPRSTPAAPAISAVALDTGAVQVSFSLGSDGGSPVTNVEYSLDGGETWTPRSPASVSSPVSISGLVGGQTYDVRVRAVNAVGAGAPSNESTVTAKGTPEAPSIDGVTPGDRSLRIAVSPGPNGGSPMTNYEVSTDGGDSWTPRVPASGASPIVVTGLTNGTTYSVRVRAVNAAGSGDASPAESATPRTTPGAPTIESDTVTGVGGELEVEFTAPGSDGGSPITGYQYSTDAGATWRDRDSGATGSPLSITTESADGATPLEGGRTYPVEIRAVNAAGPGAASAVADGITTTVPAAPVIEEVQVSHASAFVDFSTPANGGAGIIRYEYRLDDGPWTDTGSSASEFHLEGLSTSGVHTVEVRAVNDVGAGPGSASEDVWIRSAPAAPDVQDVTGGDGTLTVDFLPGDDGGDQISGYEYSTDGGVTWADAEGTASPILFGSDSEGEPLVNGTLYAVQIRARNGAGTGPASASTLVAPQGPPDAPVGIDLTPGDRRIAVDLEIPSDGGSSITGLQYRLDGGPWTDAGSLEAPFTITGLENGTAYTIEVRALNALGSGAPSEPATATASTIASAPRSVTASADDARTTVSWEAPVDDGGTEIERYDVAVFTAPGSGMPVALCSTADSTSCEIEGLENGTTYYVEVSAWNAVGPGSLNTPRVAVTPLGRPIVGIAAINPAAGELVVDVDTVDNGAPVITYEYRLDGGEWVSTSSSAEPFTIAGLETGTEYSVQVRALNSAGAGSPSEPVVATPRTLPGAPSSLVAESADGSVVLTWNAPASNGGAAITDYVVRYATSAAGPFTTADDGISGATTATVTGLTNGTGYVFRVAAVNAAGTGQGTPLASATPLAAPGAPSLDSLSVGSRYLRAAFSPPASNGGSPVTGYEYRLDDGEWLPATGTSSPITLAGLTNGRSYDVALRAVNSVGAGEASNTRTATPYGLPGGVRGFTASPGSDSVELEWDAADDNGSPISQYNIIRWSAPTEGSIAASYTTNGTSLTVPGLSPGSYWFTIEATNAAGTGQRSNPRTSTVVGGTVPGAPTVQDVVVGDGALEIHWSPASSGSASIDGYLLRQVAGGQRTTLVDSNSAATSATSELPVADQPYELQLALRSDAGIGQFTTLRPPIVGEAQVAGATTRGASLSAQVNANDRESEVGFEVAADPDELGTPAAVTVEAVPASVDGVEATVVSADATGLEPGTTYHVRTAAVSSDGVAFGPVTTFRTTASVTTSGLDVVYDGRPVSLASTTEPAGLAVERTFLGIAGTTYGPSTTPPDDVGTYRVTTQVVSDGQQGSEVADLVVRARPLDATVEAVDRDYDGTAVVDLEVSLNGAIEGDDVRLGALSASLPDPDAGVGRSAALGVDGPTLVGADAANYSVALPESVEVTIRRAEQDLAFDSAPDGPLRVGDTYTPRIVSDRGLPVTLAVAVDGAGTNRAAGEAPCVLEGDAVRAVAVGRCAVIGSQPGTENVLPAEVVVQFLTVEPAATAPPKGNQPPKGSDPPRGGFPSPGGSPATDLPGAREGRSPAASPIEWPWRSGGLQRPAPLRWDGFGVSETMMPSAASQPFGSGIPGGSTSDAAPASGTGAAAAPQPADDGATRDPRGGSGGGDPVRTGDPGADGARSFPEAPAGTEGDPGGFAGGLIAAVGDRPVPWVLVLVCFAAAGWWILGARRRRGERAERA